MRPVPRLKFKCRTCRKAFYRMACEVKRERDANPKYCSRACSALGRRRGVTRKCTGCRASFYTKRSDGCHFCSRSCQIAHQRLTSHSYPKLGGRHAHRVVMEQKVGRKLRSDEIVHHEDENKKNFAIDNLKLTTRPEHIRHHKPTRFITPEVIKRRVETRRKTLARKRRKA